MPTSRHRGGVRDVGSHRVVVEGPAWLEKTRVKQVSGPSATPDKSMEENSKIIKALPLSYRKFRGTGVSEHSVTPNTSTEIHDLID